MSILPVAAEFLFSDPPFPWCHAATIAETPGGLVTAWFAGTAEFNPDTGIWLARASYRPAIDLTGLGDPRQGRDRLSGLFTWGPIREVATGEPQGANEGIGEIGASHLVRVPCWNPVLFQVPGGPLLLFYRAGPSPSTWWGMLMASSDGGETWSEPRRLPDGIWGPIKNKPVPLPGGSLLCPTSSEDAGWRVFMQAVDLTACPDPVGGLGDLSGLSDLSWETAGPLNDGYALGAIQPAILAWPSGRLQILCRTRQGYVATSWSEDGGHTWTPLSPTALPNSNSGIDAVVLRDGRGLLVYNPVGIPPGQRGGSGPRTPLVLAVSEDGSSWRDVLVLEAEPGEYSYPAVIQAADGRVHIVYTWRKENIRHVMLDPGALRSG